MSHMARHEIVSMNIDREWSTLKNLREHLIEKDGARPPTIICIQDLANAFGSLGRLELMFGDMYECTASPRLTENLVELACYQTNEHVIMNLRSSSKIIGDPFLMPPASYDKSLTAALGIRISLRNEDGYLNRDASKEQGGDEINIFSVYVRPAAEDSDMEDLFQWLKLKANSGLGISKSIVVGDFNATNPLWDTRDIGIGGSSIEGMRTWDRIRMTRGRKLSIFIRNQKMTCLNSAERAPTFRQRCIDLAIVGQRIVNKLTINPLRVMPVAEGESRHLALILTYTFTTLQEPNTEPNQGSNKRKRRAGRPWTDHYKRFRMTKHDIENDRDDANVRLYDKTPADRLLIMCERESSREDELRSKERAGQGKVIKTMNKALITNDMFELFIDETETLMGNWRTHTRSAQIVKLDKLVELIYSTVLEVQEMITRVKWFSKKRWNNNSTRNSSQYINKNKFYSKIAKLNNFTRIKKVVKMSRKYKSCRLRMSQLVNSLDATDDRNTIRKLKSLLRSMRIKLRRMKAKINRMKRQTLIKKNVETAKRRKKAIRKQMKHVQGNLSQEELWRRLKLAEPGWNKEIKGREVEGEIESQEQLEEIAMQHFPDDPQYDGHELVKSILDKADNERAISMTGLEFEHALNDIRNKRYYTPEGIRMDIFYECTKNFIRDYVELAAHMSFKLCYIPKLCRKTRGTLIPKKEANKFRIVHVSSALAALTANIALSKLNFSMEKRKMIDDEQYGFVNHKDRHDLIAQILNITMTDKWVPGSRGTTVTIGKRITTIIGLDVQGAFDNVSHKALINKLDRALIHKVDNVKHWLLEFLINRSITLRYGNHESKPRQITKGVPQGSSLGPAMFNISINKVKLTPYIGKTTYIRLFKYADDLHLIQKGFDWEDMQLALNKVTYDLNKVGLSVNVKKCFCLHIPNVASQRYNKNCLKKKFNITNVQSGECGTIQIVKSLNILGVDFNRYLKLERKSLLEKVETVTDKLFNINLTKIVQSNREWRILIDSFLISTTIYNSWPILMLRKTDREWLDKIITKALKFIFNWPANVSNKLIRFILNLQPTEMVIEHIARLKTASSRSGTLELAYSNLLKCFELSKQESGKHYISGTTDDIAIDRTLRSSGNPEFMIANSTFNLQTLDSNYLTEYGPMWFILGRKRAAIGAETFGHRIEEIRLIVNDSYCTAYFNMVTLIWHLVNDGKIMNRKLVLARDNPLLMALKNFNSKDWRVIELRENIVKRGWQIWTLFKSDYDVITINQEKLLDAVNIKHIRPTENGRHIKELSDYHYEDLKRVLGYKQIDRQASNNTNDNPENDLQPTRGLENWGIRILNGSNNGQNPTTDTRNFPRLFNNIEDEWLQRTAICEHVNEPSFEDYQRKFVINRSNKDTFRELLSEKYCSRLMKATAGDKFLYWQELSPCFLTGVRMLTLGDMYRHGTTRALMRYDATLEQCEICNQRLDIDNNGEQLVSKTHITIHRLKSCPAFTNVRNELFRRSNINDATGESTIRTRVLGSLATCALWPQKGRVDTTEADNSGHD